MNKTKKSIEFDKSRVQFDEKSMKSDNMVHPTATSSFENNIPSNVDNDNKHKFINEFMEVNKEFFEKIGFKDISNDPIFELSNEVEPAKNSKNCSTCTKELSNFFSKGKFW
jgi:hypothetical protein